jgi:hypothetical protein
MYYLISGTEILAGNSEREFVEIDQAALGGVIVEDDYEGYNDGYAYLNGTFSKKAATVYTDRVVERAEEFAETLNNLNPLWFNSLSSQQQTDLAAWRSDWLNYPETGIKPTRPVGIF